MNRPVRNDARTVVPSTSCARYTAGFTLIELLIVVAIIAILAAIAVPNFLEAQTRAKTARVKNDERSLATALESYRVDYNKAAPDFVDTEKLNNVPQKEREIAYSRLTTPTAYMTSYVYDPFAKFIAANRDEQRFYYYACSTIIDNTISRNYAKRAYEVYRGYEFGFFSVGPRSIEQAPFPEDMMAGPNASYLPTPSPNIYSVAELLAMLYDPTNGTVTLGRIVRTNKGIMSGGELGFPGP